MKNEKIRVKYLLNKYFFVSLPQKSSEQGIGTDSYRTDKGKSNALPLY